MIFRLNPIKTIGLLFIGNILLDHIKSKIRGQESEDRWKNENFCAF